MKTPVPNTDRAFKVEQHNGPVSIVLAGSFGAGDTASGTLEVTDATGPCADPIATTWQASLAG